MRGHTHALEHQVDPDAPRRVDRSTLACARCGAERSPQLIVLAPSWIPNVPNRTPLCVDCRDVLLEHPPEQRLSSARRRSRRR
jgi:hypothetical protein